MIQLFFLITAYGAFIILLMAQPDITIPLAAILLVLGTGVIIRKKSQLPEFCRSRDVSLIPYSVVMTLLLLPDFWDQFYASPRIHALMALLHLPLKPLLILGIAVLVPLAVCLICLVLTFLQARLGALCQHSRFRFDIMFCLIAAVSAVHMSHYMISVSILPMGLMHYGANVLIVLTLILGLYGLTARPVPAIALGMGFFMIVSTINVYVVQFRVRLFAPADLFSAGTAMNVLGNYSLFPIPCRILFGWAFFAALLLFFMRLRRRAGSGLPAKKRLALAAFCVACTVSICMYSASLPVYHWKLDGALFNGYILDFTSKLREIMPPEPDHYSPELIAALADQYASDGGASDTEPAEPPHIIVIMDEAFSDLSIAGAFSTNTEVTPFISSLKEDTITGYALTSVHGGNTANSEYELLTGNTMAWLSPNAVPYQQYLQTASCSMVSWLKGKYDYRCLAMHPFYASGWNRPEAYENLGFDACYFIEDFPQEQLIREYISDQEMFECLIETYEQNRDEPLFLFGVTMQNHGPYDDTGENLPREITVEEPGGTFSEAEQYLSLLHETDRAVAHLVTYFQNVDDDVVILFFGDHQPRLKDSFYETIHNGDGDSLDERQTQYLVPFFIWANYDLPEEHIRCTSLNYLSSYLYEAAGLTLPPYNRFLREMEAVIPAINAYGFYSLAQGRYLRFEEAGEKERRWLQQYEALQYNNTFDHDHHNSTLFPLLEE